MNKKILYCFTILLLIIISTSCSTIKKTGSSRARSSVKAFSQDDKDQITNILIDGKKEELLGNIDNAANIFQKCLAKDPNNGACKYELASLFVLKKNYNAAMPLLIDAVKAEPENEWYKLQLAKVYEQLRKYDEEVKIYESLIKDYPDRIDYYYGLATVYIITSKNLNAIKVYNDIEAVTGINEDLSIQKKNLYLNINKLDKAVNEIQRLIDKYPKEIKYYNLKADIYLANKLPEKAFEIYQNILKIDASDPNVHLSLAEYYRVKGDNEKSFEELKSAFSNIKLGIDTKIGIMLSYYMVSENYNDLKAQAYTLIDIMIKTHPNEAKVYAMSGDFLSRDKKYKEARDQYHKVISLDSSQYTVWEQLLYLESELKDYKLLDNESSKAIELFPLQPIPYLLNGDANFRLKNFNKAIVAFKNGSKVTVDSDDLLMQFYSYLGDTYNELKNYSSSDSAYDKALSLKPDNEGVLNNYAYFLSVRGDRLEKAEQMASKAVEISPNSPSYLDTYGWVLYKAGKYDKAKEIIEKALEKGGTENDVILEHYGDIMYKTGYTSKAIEYWKKAKDYGKGSELLDKKIAEEKLYE